MLEDHFARTHGTPLILTNESQICLSLHSQPAADNSPTAAADTAPSDALCATCVVEFAGTTCGMIVSSASSEVKIEIGDPVMKSGESVQCVPTSRLGGLPAGVVSHVWRCLQATLGLAVTRAALRASGACCASE